MSDPDPDPEPTPDTDTNADPHQVQPEQEPQDDADAPFVVSMDPTTITDPSKRHGDPDGPDDDAGPDGETRPPIGDRNPFPDGRPGPGPVQPMAKSDTDPDPNPNALPTLDDDWDQATEDTNQSDTPDPDLVVVRAGISPRAAMSTASTIDSSLRDDVDGLLFPLFIAGDDIQMAKDALTSALSDDGQSITEEDQAPIVRYPDAPIHLELWLSEREAQAFIDGIDTVQDMDTGHDVFLMEFMVDPATAAAAGDHLMDAVRQIRRRSGIDSPSGGA